MSCDQYNSSGASQCPPINGSSTGKKISELTPITSASHEDLFVIVDMSENKTNNITYGSLFTFDSSGTSLSATTFQEAIIELDKDLTAHIEDYANPHQVTPDQVYNTSAIWNADKLQGTDVSIISPTSGQILIYNAILGKWIPQTPSTSVGNIKYVKSGGINGNVIMDINSAFTGTNGFQIPTSDYEMTINDITITTALSYHDGLNVYDTTLRLAEVNNNLTSAFSSGDPVEIFRKDDLLSNSIQVGTIYSFSFTTTIIPIKLTPDKMLFCEFDPKFWIFEDVEISVAFSMKRV